MAIEIDASLSNSDWEPRQGGWRCEALSIPGAELSALFYDGNKADTKNYSVDRDVIRWSGANRPSEAIARIVFTKDLPKLEDDKLQLEKDKFELEIQKTRSEKKWKVITAIGTVLSFILTFIGTYFLVKPGDKNNNSNSAQTNISYLKSKLGPDTINLLKSLPPDGVDIIMATTTRMDLMGHNSDEKGYTLPDNYETLKRLEQLGFIDFKINTSNNDKNNQPITSSELDVALKKMKTVKGLAGQTVYLETQVSTDQIKMLQNIYYELTDNGKNLYKTLIDNSKEQIKASAQ